MRKIVPKRHIRPARPAKNMIVFYKVPSFYQETTSAAFLMVIGLFDVEVGQIQCASWDHKSQSVPSEISEAVFITIV